MHEISGLIKTKLECSLWTGLPVSPTNGINEVVVNYPFEILLSNFFAFDKKQPQGVPISYVTRISVINWVDTGTFGLGICESLSFQVSQDTAAAIRQSRAKVTDRQSEFSSSNFLRMSARMHFSGIGCS